MFGFAPGADVRHRRRVGKHREKLTVLSSVALAFGRASAACNLSEHHSFGESEDVAGDYAEELAAEMLATTLGLEFDPGKSWDENKEVYRLSNQIVRDPERHPDAVGDKKGLWTTVVPRRS